MTSFMILFVLFCSILISAFSVAFIVSPAASPYYSLYFSNFTFSMKFSFSCFPGHPLCKMFFSDFFGWMIWKSFALPPVFSLTLCLFCNFNQNDKIKVETHTRTTFYVCETSTITYNTRTEIDRKIIGFNFLIHFTWIYLTWAHHTINMRINFMTIWTPTKRVGFQLKQLCKSDLFKVVIELKRRTFYNL